MKKYVFSGNKYWLNKVKEEFGDSVTVSDDYTMLLEVSEQPNVIIATLHDPEYPLDTKHKETPFLLNEMRHTEPGTYLSDIFIHKNAIQKSALEELKARFANIDKVLKIMKDIQDGTYHVRYSGWSFSGGRGEDGQMFDIIDETNKNIGRIYLMEDNDLTVSLHDFYYSNSGWYNRSSPTIAELVSSTVFSALPRDDSEICDIIADENGFSFPVEFYDVSREDVICMRSTE